MRLSPVAWDDEPLRASRARGEAVDFDMAEWRGYAVSSADSAIDALDVLVAGGMSAETRGEAEGVLHAEEPQAFWASLEHAARFGSPPERMREVMVQLRDRLASANLSDSGEVTLSASSARGADGKMSSAELAAALGLMPGSGELFLLSGADALLAAAPTAKGFAAACSAMSAAPGEILSLPGIAGKAAAERDEVVGRFASGELAFDEAVAELSAVNDEALSLWESSRARIDDALAEVPAATPQYDELYSNLEYYTRASAVAAVAVVRSDAEALAKAGKDLRWVSGEAALALSGGYGAGRDLSALAAVATEVAYAVMAEDLSSGGRRMSYQEVVSHSAAALASRDDLPSVRGFGHEEVCVRAVSSLRRYQLECALDNDRLLRSEEYARQTLRLEPPTMDFVASCSFIPHVDTFLDELQTPSMTGNAAASRKMALLMQDAALSADRAVEWLEWRVPDAQVQDGAPGVVGGYSAPTLSAEFAADRESRDFAIETLPLIHVGTGPYRGIAPTPTVTALAAHLPDAELAGLAGRMDLSDGWQGRAADSLAARFSMSREAASKHVARLSDRIGAIVEGGS